MTRTLELQARARLLQRRQMLHAEMGDGARREHEIDIADLANRAEAAQRAGLITERQARELIEIEGALHRIHCGEYGLCQECGGPIGRLRLLALPEARTCVECDSELAVSPVRPARLP